MGLRAATCVLLWSVLAGRCIAQSEKSLPPAYTPLPAQNADGGQANGPPIQGVASPDALREDYNIHPFYAKHVVLRAIAVMRAKEVTDYAFLECAWTLDHMLHERGMALKALVAAKVRVGIIGVQQYTMDIPENQRPGMMAKAAHNDRRSRG